MILRGTTIAKAQYEVLRQEIRSFTSTPTLCAFLVWNSPESLTYIRQKQKASDSIWVRFELVHLPSNTTQQTLTDAIQQANKRADIHGIMVQLPLPSHIDALEVIHSIDPQKDVDGFHPENQWKIVTADQSGLFACTPSGVMELLSNVCENFEWKNVVIVGRSNIVGKPLANLLINAGATLSVCNSKTQDIEFYTKHADIVIMATWKPWLLKNQMLWEWAIVIDVGFSYIKGKICGDAEFDEIDKAWHTITPVPGWVGPMTVLHLMKNTIKAYKNQQQ